MLKNLKVFVALGGLRPLLQSAVQHAHGTSLWHPGLEDHPTVVNHREYRGEKKKGYLFLDSDVFFRGRFWILFGFLVLCFPASLLFCSSCFSAFPVSFFSASLLSLLLCFSACVLLCLSTSTILPFFSSIMCFCCSTSCSFASLLPVFTASVFFLFFCFIFSCLYPKWSPKDPRWNPKKPKRNPDKNSWQETPIWNPEWTLKKP